MSQEIQSPDPTAPGAPPPAPPPAVEAPPPAPGVLVVDALPWPHPVAGFVVAGGAGA